MLPTDSSRPKGAADNSKSPYDARLPEHLYAVVSRPHVDRVHWIDKCRDNVDIAGRFRAIPENKVDRSCVDLNARKLKRDGVGLFDRFGDSSVDFSTAGPLGLDGPVDDNLWSADAVESKEFLVALQTS